MKRIAMFIMLMTVPFLAFSQSNRVHETYTVGDDLGVLPRFSKDQSGFRMSDIYGVIPCGKGYIIKLRTQDGRFPIEFYAEVGTRFYADTNLVIEITKIEPNRFEVDAWTDDSTRCPNTDEK